MIRLATTENSARRHHYRSVVERFEFTDELAPPFDQTLCDVDGLIVSCDQYMPSRLAIAACKRKNIPTFHIIDGGVDWRTTFQNPQFDLEDGGTPLFQPLLCDYVFVMGSLQKQQLRWLGNDHLLPFGLPRFDDLKRRACRVGGASRCPRILIATANTPWATREQQDRVGSQFVELTRALSLRTDEMEIKYRIANSLRGSVDVEIDSSGSAADALEGVDAVVSTPSTFAVESMILGIPTLIFDPFSNPIFIPSAWHATHWESVVWQMPSLLCVEPARASYQDWLVRSSYTADGNASERIAHFIESLVQGKPAKIPNADCDRRSMSATYEAFKGRVFTEQQIASLESSVASFDHTIGVLRKQVKTLSEQRASSSPRFLLGTVARYARSLTQRRKVPPDND